MEAASLALAIPPVLVGCAKLATLCSDFQTKYQSAPSTLASVITECNGVSHILVEIQYLGLQNIVCLSGEQQQRFCHGIDALAIGCTREVSTIEQHVKKFSYAAEGVIIGPLRRFERKDKMKIVWNEDGIKQSLERLRGYQTNLVAFLLLVNLYFTLSTNSFLDFS